MLLSERHRPTAKALIGKVFYKKKLELPLPLIV